MINKIIEGDCLQEMDKLEKGSIDLIYLDPPFFTDKKHKLKNKERTKEFSFDDIWVNDLTYAEFLKERIIKMKPLLKDEGAIFVHCDKSCEHIIRAILDEVFGVENFQSEIIWHYKRWSNSKKGLLPSHQNIYFYSKTKNFKFNTIYNSYSETTNIDQILQKRKRDLDNKSVYDVDGNGNFIHAEMKKGVPLGDVWEMPYLNPKAKERVGYPTQKPLLLLERIIDLVTDKGDVVLDPFCGSGTTCVAAKLKLRNFVGIDQSREAVEISISRLQNPVKTESNLLKRGRDSYVNADKVSLGLLSGLEYNPVQRNKGIDAILIEHFDNSPVLVRSQKDNESLSESVFLLLKAMKKKRSKKAILIQTKVAVNQFDEVDEMDGIEIIKSPAVQVMELLNNS